MNLSNELRKLEGQHLLTLAQNLPFTVQQVTGQQVVVVVGSTGQPRPIPVTQIEAAWKALSTKRELSLVEIQHNYADYNPTYVSAILAHMPGVTVRTRPVRLFYKPDLTGFTKE